MQIMNWVVGVDLGASSQGALKVAHWLHARTSGLTHRFCAVHVIEDRWFSNATYPGLGPEVDRARDLVRSSIAASPAREAIGDVEVLRGHDAATELSWRARSIGAGIIIGRAGRADGWSFLNLGSTARRLLRRGVTAVCVAPPDLDRDRLDPGPVIVSLRPDDGCLDALRFAATLGRDLGREVIGAHSIPLPSAYASTDVALAVAPPVPRMIDLDRVEAGARKAIEKWAQGSDLWLPELRCGVGPAAQVVTDVADDTEACSIVCAARALTPLERIIHSSVATELAAHASLPVFVVPEA